ncbi:MAG: fumarylacetoacetate hydrolase family protein [Comamonadaceae bacterium]|nr:fumarylacetoacetate hydrolase family protein [Comamonadaceae bacterium]
MIGKRCRARLRSRGARSYIFGYTCVNDVTALELISRDPSFAAMDARQELRRLRRVRPGHRHRPRPAALTRDAPC